MKSNPFRQGAMRFLIAALLLASASALAQSSEEFTAPPMVPADQPADAPVPQPLPPGSVQMIPVDPNQPQQQQYPQQQYPQQQYPQQQYPQQQYPQQQYPQQQYPQQQQQRQAPPEKTVNSERTKHFLGLLSGSFGIGDTSAGLIGSARIEIDISKFGLLFGYNNFNWSSSGFGIQVHQFHAMGGYSLFSSDLLTWRLLGGLDIMARDSQTAFNVILGTNLRSMWGRVGLDGAFMMTLFPFRQIEGRLAFVFQWSVFEAHLGWRVQVIDATASGDLGTLFTNSPGVSGPVAGIGVAF